MTARSQITSNILVVRPASFGFNCETAADNVFQAQANLGQDTIHVKAVQEFDQFVNLLRQHKINVTVTEDDPSLKVTDAVFPNNWISCHHDGTVFLYPMLSSVRRRERRLEILDVLRERFHIKRIVDLTHFENQGKFLEGTGSLILDHENGIAYMCLSKRSKEDVYNKFATELNYYRKSVIFEAFDPNQQPIYHTNVIMCLGKDFAIVCLEAIKNEEQKVKLTTSLKSTGKTIVEITMDQVYQFAGNMLQVCNKNGERFLIMSSRAFAILTKDQVRQLESFNQKIVHSNLETIESVGGGSARCMMAEIFLPPVAK